MSRSKGQSLFSVGYLDNNSPGTRISSQLQCSSFNSVLECCQVYHSDKPASGYTPSMPWNCTQRANYDAIMFIVGTKLAILQRKFHTIGIDVHHAEEWEASRSLSTIATFEDDERILKTRGFVVGEISKKSHQFRSTPSNPVEAAKSFRAWLKFAMSAKLYAVPGGSSDGTAALVEATTILYEAIVKTRLGELGRPSCQLDRFRSYCEKILYDPDLPEETEWPFSAVDDPVDTISERQRLCEIELSACQISKVSDNQATFPQSNEPNEIQITSDQKNIVSTIGLCPVYANRGNVVAVIRGCRYPIVLRKAEHGYMVTNSIYMHGFMKGEAVDRFPEVDIELI